MTLSLNEIKAVEENLGVTFNNKGLLTEALTHRSYLNEAKDKKLNSNERLEFLGDSVLAFWVSGQIFRQFPDLPEGKLTFIRTYLVRTETLTGLSQKLNLGHFLLMSKGEEQGGGRENPLLLANAFEAVTGAVFLDQGIAAAGKFLQSQLAPVIASITSAESLKDSKSRLQELVQAQGKTAPVYKIISSTGPDHQKTFVMGAYLEDKLLAEGTSKSKQEAEEEAARAALEILGKIK